MFAIKFAPAEIDKLFTVLVPIFKSTALKLAVDVLLLIFINDAETIVFTVALDEIETADALAVKPAEAAPNPAPEVIFNAFAVAVVKIPDEFA